MMRAIFIVLGTIGVLSSGSALANGKDVLEQKGCFNCHDMTQQKVGPSYQAVAAKYANDKNAQSMLVDKLKNGTDHMKISATDAELNEAIRTVLSTK